MKTLLLLRHGKSDWHAHYSGDHERPLAPRGKKAVRAMGEWLSKTGPVPEAIVCSTAMRARQTCSCLLEAATFTAPVTFTSELYGADVDDLLSLIHATGAGPSVLMLIGHEPTWSRAIGRFTLSGPCDFPTAALARISFAVDTWQRVACGAGKLVWLQKPRELP